MQDRGQNPLTAAQRLRLAKLVLGSEIPDKPVPFPNTTTLTGMSLFHDAVIDAAMFKWLSRSLSYDYIKAIRKENVLEDVATLAQAIAAGPSSNPMRLLEALRSSITQSTGDVLGLELRVEYTRLFSSTPILVPLCGSSYLPPIPACEGGGESILVEREYKAQGLSAFGTSNEPADFIVREWDFMYYLRFYEAASWMGQDSQSAMEWSETARHFYESHLCDFASRLSEKLQGKSSHPYFRMVCAMLDAAAERQSATA